MTPTELGRHVRNAIGLLEDALEEYRRSGVSEAETERAYRMGRAEAWLDVSGNVKQKEDQVNARTADLRFERDMAQAVRRSAYEALRVYESELSAFQTLANAHRAEAEFAKTGPT